MPNAEDAVVDRVRVTVIYALPDEQYEVTVTLPDHATVEEAVERSGLAQRFPAIGSRPLQCAVFNRLVGGSEVARDGDRIDVLRPLQVDPKEQRRREAARMAHIKRR